MNAWNLRRSYHSKHDLRLEKSFGQQRVLDKDLFRLLLVLFDQCLHLRHDVI